MVFGLCRERKVDAKFGSIARFGLCQRVDASDGEVMSRSVSWAAGGVVVVNRVCINLNYLSLIAHRHRHRINSLLHPAGAAVR